MNIQELKDYICERGYEDAIVFENPSYTSAFIGITTDGRTVYDYELMTDYLMEKEGFSYEDAIEFIDYNTIRALPYMGPNAPVIIYPSML